MEKKHKYFPDFSVDGKLIEIKGDHFFKEGKMICPFRNERYSQGYLNNLLQVKYNCAIENDVTFLFEEDLKALGIF